MVLTDNSKIQGDWKQNLRHEGQIRWDRIQNPETWVTALRAHLERRMCSVTQGMEGVNRHALEGDKRSGPEKDVYRRVVEVQEYDRGIVQCFRDQPAYA